MNMLPNTEFGKRGDLGQFLSPLFFTVDSFALFSAVGRILPRWSSVDLPTASLLGLLSRCSVFAHIGDLH